jgi:hypothetical protein
MHRPAPRSHHALLLSALALAGCATVAAPTRRTESPYARFERIKDSLEAVAALGAAAGDDDAGSAPRVSLFIPPAGYTMVNYVDAAFRVSDDAYVLVLTVDRDRRVRVLYPESPSESGFAERRAATHLTRFFGGFGSRPSAYGSYDLSQRLSPFGAGGVLLAVASDRPLQLERLADGGGDWDAQRLEQLVYEHTMPAAAQSVARALLVPGQEFSTDYLTFGGSRTLDTYRSYASGFDACGSRYGFGPRAALHALDPLGLPGYGSAEPLTRFLGLLQRDGQTYARYVTGGGCSTPFFYDIPTAPRPAPAPQPADTIRRDSVATSGRWAMTRDDRERSPGTPAALSGLRFRALDDASGSASATPSHTSPRWSAAPGHRSPSTPDGSTARFSAPTRGVAASPDGWTRAASHAAPRVEWRENVRVPVRAELSTTVRRREEAQRLSAH